MLRINSKNIWHDRDSNPKLTACEPRTSIIFAHLQCFDQHLQTVKNKTTVLILVFKEFLQTSIPPQKFILYAGGCHDFLMRNFCLTVPKNFVRDSNCFWKNSGFEKFCGWKEVYHVFPPNFFGLTVLKNFVGITSMLQKNRDIENIYA